MIKISIRLYFSFVNDGRDQINRYGFQIEMDQNRFSGNMGGWQLKGGDHLEGSNRLQNINKFLKKEVLRVNLYIC
jgi:hypothetical protein